MTSGEVEMMLRAWGRVYGEAPDYGDDERPAPATHPIAVAMVFAPGKKVRRLDLALRRMIRKGERAWSRDPIVCTETRSACGPSGGGSSFSPQAERVQTVVSEIRRDSEVIGLVLEAQYCKRGTQREKAAWVTGMGHRMVVRTYRRHLVSGREMVAEKIA